MSSNYIFSLTPTFTQGLVLGQLSILVLLALILKYLFLDSGPSPVATPLSYSAASFDQDRLPNHRQFFPVNSEQATDADADSTAWFNLILRQVGRPDQVLSRQANDSLPAKDS